MNWRVYFEGGGGWGGFSPCSQDKIATYLSTNPVPACLADVNCGDVNISGIVCTSGSSPGAPCFTNTDCGSGGTCISGITSTDALQALSYASLAIYDDLGDILPFGTPDGSLTATDAQYLLNVAVALPGYPAPTICGVDNERW
jgi:hypothetical protein